MTTRGFEMDWLSLAKHSKQLVPTPHSCRLWFSPLRFQTKRQAYGPCRRCLSVIRLQTSVQNFYSSCRLQSRRQASERRQSLFLVAATTDPALHLQPGVKVRSTRTPTLLHIRHQQHRDSAGLLLWLRLAIASSSAWSCWVRGCRQGCTHGATQA